MKKTRPDQGSNYHRKPGTAARTGLAAVLAMLLITPFYPIAANAESFPPEGETLNLVSGLDEGVWRTSSSSNTRFSDEGRQLRVRSSSTRAIPDGDAYSWLGPAGEVRWNTASWNYKREKGLSFIQFSNHRVKASQLAEDSPNVRHSISNLQAPGTFVFYEAIKPEPESNEPIKPGELFRWGTGAQRDGTPHELDTKFTFPLRRDNGEAAFGASGMYCFDLTSEATLADGTEVSDTETIRIAVGDEVAADAACGTATGETPQLPDTPEEPIAPKSSVAGDTVTVEWKTPRYIGRYPIMKYTVTLRDPNREELTTEVDGQMTAAVFENVPAGHYKANVIAANEHHESDPSVWSNEIVVSDPIRVINEGHIDAIAPQVDVDPATGELSLALRAHHDDYGWLEWDNFVLYNDDSVAFTLPDQFTPEQDWSFLGEPGAKVWQSPQAYVSGAPWVGLSVESPSGLREHGAAGSNTVVGVRIDGVTGVAGPAPGEFAFSRATLGDSESKSPWATGALLEANTREAMPNGFLTPLGNHIHYGWYFTQPGVYCIAVAVDVELTDGKRHTAQGLLTHVLGDESDPTQVIPCGRQTEYPAVTEPASVPDGQGDTPFLLDQGFGNVSLAYRDGGFQANLLHSSSYRNGQPTRHDLDNVVFRGKVLLNSNGRPQLGKFPYVYVVGDSQHSFRPRDDIAFLRWNTFGVPQDQIQGDIAWSIDNFKGPGELRVTNENRAVFDTANGVTQTKLWTQSGNNNSEWRVTAPGRYCVDLSWQANTIDGEQLSHSKTITIVVDGESFEHDEATLTQTCAEGADATPPNDSGDHPDPEPEDKPWEVSNWSETVSGAKILNLGHIDVASVLTDGKLDTLIKDTTTEGAEAAGKDNDWVSWHQPEHTVFQLLPNSKVAVPDREGYGFLGEAGTPLWRVNDTQHPDLLWPGWSTEHIDRAVSYQGVNWRLTGMDGPGDFFLYQSTDQSPTVHFNTADGIDQTDTMLIHPRAHVHGSWAFTAEGVYCLAFERTATMNGNAQKDTFTLAVAVGETDPTVIDPANCVENTQPGGDDPGSEPPGGDDPGTDPPAGVDDPGTVPGGSVTPVLERELTEANRGGVSVPESASRGQQITVHVGTAHAGKQVRIWLHSTPVLLGTVTLDTAGIARVTIPNDAVLGNHRVVVQALNGSLIGWDGIKIRAVSQPGQDGQSLVRTGADLGPWFPLTAAVTILVLAAAVILTRAHTRRRAEN